MPRAPFQVVVMPFRSAHDGVPQYCVMRRADQGYWQFVAGGGEDDESPERAARREALEEAGFPDTAPLYRLQSMDTVPVTSFRDRTSWPRDLYVVPQYVFAISAGSHEIVLSAEHTEARWAGYETVSQLLRWQSNQTALWELHERLRRHDLPAPLGQGYPR